MSDPLQRHISFARSVAYNTAKAGINHMGYTMATELTEHRINVNVIEPGWTDTPGERNFATEEELREGGVSDTQQPPPLDERQVRSNTDTSILPLPSFTPADNQLSIGEFDFDSSSQIINAAYEEIVHFIPNLFPVPSGSIGSQFVNIIAQLFQCFGDVARGEGIAIKTAMVATQLLLQQPHSTFDRAAHVQCLQHRLSLWSDGNIDKLMQECRYIQKQIKDHASTPRGKTNNPDSARTFASLVTRGKIGAATSMLSDGYPGGLHNIDD